MKNLQEIKENYAIEQGFPDWDDLWHAHIYELLDFEMHMNEICILAQKVALENAAENLQQCSGSFNSDYQSQKRQITNPENLIR